MIFYQRASKFAILIFPGGINAFRNVILHKPNPNPNVIALLDI
jgi:hypothetical protein